VKSVPGTHGEDQFMIVQAVPGGLEEDFMVVKVVPGGIDEDQFMIVEAVPGGNLDKDIAIEKLGTHFVNINENISAGFKVLDSVPVQSDSDPDNQNISNKP